MRGADLVLVRGRLLGSAKFYQLRLCILGKFLDASSRVTFLNAASDIHALWRATVA